MPRVAPTIRELIRANRVLPEDLRDRSIMLVFAEPVPVRKLDELYRLHFSPRMLQGGEDKPYRADELQPHRVGMQLCHTCWKAMAQVDLGIHRCTNPACVQRDGTPSNTLHVVTAPLRGMIKVQTGFDGVTQGRKVHVSFIVGQERYEARFLGGEPKTLTDNVVDRCLLLLDRRYHPDVLAAVFRTAAEICAEQGWKLAP